MSNYSALCYVSTGDVATAPPPPLLASGDEADRHYVFIESNFIEYLGLNHVDDVEGGSVVIPRTEFLANSGPVIRGITGHIWPDVPAIVDEFVIMTSQMVRAAMETPTLAEAPMLPLRLTTLVCAEDDADDAARDYLIGARSWVVYAAETLGPISVPAAADEWAVEALVECGESPEDHDICSICIIEFGGPKNLDGDDDKIVRTPCSHVYHRKCIVQWLRKSHSCPLCRYAFPAST